jgi:hypothetical protein
MTLQSENTNSRKVTIVRKKTNFSKRYARLGFFMVLPSVVLFLLLRQHQS